VEIIFHAHRAVISNNMRLRAERVARKLGARVRRPVDAIVRFEQDGPTRRVEIVLHAPGKRSIVAEGSARHYGPALADAATRMEARLGRVKRTPKARARAGARTVARV
jgi:ribosome-associated translation inhibitor RaiA